MSNPIYLTESTYENTVHQSLGNGVSGQDAVARALGHVAVQMFGFRADLNRHMEDVKQNNWSLLETGANKLSSIAREFKKGRN